MDLDLTINLGHIVSLVVTIVAIAAGYATLKATVANLKTTVDGFKAVVEELGKQQEETARHVADVRAAFERELAAFQIEVAKTYVTSQAIKDVEQRIMDRFSELRGLMALPVSRRGQTLKRRRLVPRRVARERR